MAKIDSTRPGFDLSPGQGLDPLTIRQAACMWARLPMNMTAALIQTYPEQWATAQDCAQRLVIEAESVRLAYEKPLPLMPGALLERAYSNALTGERRPARYEMVPDWGAARVARADLRAFAESIGERPAFLFPESECAEMKQGTPERHGAVCDTSAAPPKEWARGIRHVAFGSSSAIVGRADKLTAAGLEKAMLDSGKVELKNDEYQLKSTDASLSEREMKAKPATIAGWVTALKKLLQK